MTLAQQAHYQWIIDRGGGVIACGEHLGVFISKPENAQNCPAGWTFVDVTNTSVEDLAKWARHTTQGRQTWPENDKA